MNRRTSAASVGLLTMTFTLFVAGSRADTTDNEQVAEALKLAQSLDSTLETAADATMQLVSGAVTGVGVGLILGSLMIYKYWQGKIT